MGAATDLVKSTLDYLLGGPAVGGADEDRLRRWLAISAADLVLPHARARYVALSTSVNIAQWRQRPIALAAIAVERMQLDYGACFCAALRAPPRGDAKAAMLDFVEFLQKAPLVAFDAATERGRLEREMKSTLGVPLRHLWIDLGALLRALFRDTRNATLDDWLSHFRLALDVRDPPLRDALAGAQLTLIALDAATRAGASNARALIDLARAT